MMSEDKATILYVDDQSIMRMSVRMIMKEVCNVELVESGREAFKFLEQADSLPSLILLDVMMPEMSGFEVCEKLKSDERYKDIPVIFVSARQSEDDEYKGLMLGAIDYIRKPYSAELMKVRILNYIDLVRKTEFVDNMSILDSI